MTDFHDDDDDDKVDFPSNRRVHKARAPDYQSSPPPPRRRRPPPQPAAAIPEEPPPDKGDAGAAAEAPATEPEVEEGIGYGRPPKRTRFRKGQSGNPRGRPKGARSSTTMLRKIGEEGVKVRGADGKPRKMSRRELSYRKFWERASNGDPKAVAIAIALWPDDEVPHAAEERLTTAQRAMLRAHGIDVDEDSDEGEDK
jgi:hypothetical protein